LNSDENLEQARQFLVRAVGRDPTRAKYHLYVGWVAMELGDLSQAALSFDKTIELDRTLADAYWKRGELRVRNGAVVDALLDLDKALELAPSRLEAHAAAARAYEQIGKEQEALASWEKAVGAEVAEPVWNFQYGELLYVNRREAEARDQLNIAISAGDKVDPPPNWLADAHRFYAMTLGRGKPALKHWQRYLELKSNSNDPYKKEAMREVDAILKMQGF
jgi:Tfp pilus assembly protein PilF